ncbi:MAG: hypothetical protein E7Z75_00970 [Methanobrevibacter olleyae]|uniref:Uncharacterized protein n=1 Tax=Methanobrevibacter olleyae TaxID=294671 RepID=A0A8T3VP27_METOL|nr:hypothetical protein [Methanobrevibacter olleyae]
MLDLENLFKRFSFEKNDNGFRIYNLIILIVGLSLYLLNNHFLHEINWFFMFYFNDFLAILVLLSFLNLVYPYKLTNVWLIIIVTILASFVWEYVALFIKAGSIFDFMDIVCYFGSMGIYIIPLYFLEGKINTSM